MPPIDLDLKEGIRNCVETTIQPGFHKEITINKGTIYTHTRTQYIILLKVRSLHHLGNGSNTVDYRRFYLESRSPLLSEGLPPPMPEEAP